MFKYVLIALMALGSIEGARADERSEAAASELLHRRLQNENPTDAAMLASVHGKDIVVVAGSMDHIEQVLNAARIPYTLIQPDKVSSYQFRANMIAMVDCPGIMPSEGVQRLEKWCRSRSTRRAATSCHACCCASRRSRSGGWRAAASPSRCSTSSASRSSPTPTR
jgi:hypothetical protein